MSDSESFPSSALTEFEEDSLSQTYSALTGALDNLIEVWEGNPLEPPDLAVFLPARKDSRLLVLVELIKIDLEYRWTDRRAPKTLDEYLVEFKELEPTTLPADLIYEEFHFRNRAGERVSRSDYLERFPAQADALERLLQIDEPYQTTRIFTGSAKTPLEEFAPGMSVDDFDLLTALGEGAFAKVFLARQRSMQRLVALKVSADSGTEPQTLAQLDHDHIVRVYDVRQLPADQLRLLYMQYLPGGTLQQVVRMRRIRANETLSGRILVDAVKLSLESRGEASSGPQQLSELDWATLVCQLGAGLARGLEYAHRRNVLHRDIKPANVLLTADGQPKLADFNISFSSDVEGDSAESYFGGSLAYMSPEQLEACHPTLPRQANELDGRSDVYSLGVVVWELLTGYRPFDDEVAGRERLGLLDEMIARRQAGPDESSLSGCGSCTEGLRHALHGALQPDREQRWSSAGEFAKRLEVCLEPRAEQLLFTPDSNWQQWMRWLTPLVFVLLAGIPNGLAAWFNYEYNDHHIIDQLRNSGTKEAFDYFAAWVNGICFPVGLGLGIAYSWSIRKTVLDCLAGRPPDASRFTQQRHRCLRFGLVGAVIGVSLWTIAGVLYPIYIGYIHPNMPYVEYIEFFGSMVLSGLIAAVYPFFFVTWFSLRLLYPPLLQTDLNCSADVDQYVLLKRLNWTALGLAALIPMLAVVAVITMNALSSGGESDATWALVCVSIGGLLGVIAAAAIFRILDRDLTAFEQIASH
ncbi:serine/threonine-protein kinase [Calycomorphotria hydatis]|uniref:Serine/threonine-protein kinase PrkC n=1 Tax=Calycomorphotria hydatis TaxID=2528027 RepID=A0A517TEX5_9PLAN|nr:serine/threonine-protein kinase [Calycomorphotria hydatis]QDT66931.1 Serine/threonine-protein kinase PrkC [Calycomorphotria hydatis]